MSEEYPDGDAGTNQRKHDVANSSKGQSIAFTYLSPFVRFKEPKDDPDTIYEGYILSPHSNTRLRGNIKTSLSDTDYRLSFLTTDEDFLRAQLKPITARIAHAYEVFCQLPSSAREEIEDWLGGANEHESRKKRNPRIWELLGVEEKFCRQVVPTGWKKLFHLGTGVRMSAEKTKTTPPSWLVVFRGTEIDLRKFPAPSSEDRELLRVGRPDTTIICSSPAVNNNHEPNFYGTEQLIPLGNRGNMTNQDSRDGDARIQVIEHGPEPFYRRRTDYQNFHQSRFADCYKYLDTNDNTTSFAFSVFDSIELEACRSKSNRRRPHGCGLDSYARPQQGDLDTNLHCVSHPLYPNNQPCSQSSSKFEDHFGALRPRPRPPVPRSFGHGDKLTKIQEFEGGLSSIKQIAYYKRQKQACKSLLDSGLDHDDFRPPRPDPRPQPPKPRPDGISTGHGFTY